MSSAMFDKFILTAPQDTFELSRAYNPGTDSLYVYVNGLFCTAGQQYNEISHIAIQFTEMLEAGDTIIIAQSAVQTALEIDFTKQKLIGNDENSVFKRYADSPCLLPNQRYELEFTLLGKKSTFIFTSKYTPLYSTVKIIRNDLMDLLSKFEDDTINFAIWQSSLLANTLAATAIKEEAVPFYAKQWVRYTAEIDIVNTIYMAIATKAGSVSKKLGELNIEKSTNIPYLSDLLKELKRKLEPFDNQLTGVNVVGKAFLKAGKTTYPIADRRSF